MTEHSCKGCLPLREVPANNEVIGVRKDGGPSETVWLCDGCLDAINKELAKIGTPVIYAPTEDVSGN